MTIHALRSYQYGNGGRDLAKEIADAAEVALTRSHSGISA